MYKFIFESEDFKVLNITQFDKLKDVLDLTPQYENVERYNLADLYDKVNYSINILKPVPEENDFVFIYTHPVFWNYFKTDLHEYLLGRLFIQSFSKFINFDKLSENLEYFNNERCFKGIFKVYEDEKLVKIWSILNLAENGLIYICMEDQTDLYLEKQKEDTIFKYSAFPIVEINQDGDVIRINKAYEDFIGYNLSELNNIGLDSTVYNINSPNPKINHYIDGFKLVLNKEIKYDDSEIELVTKSGEHKLVNAHLRLVSDGLIQVTLHDITELKESQKNAIDLNEYLSDIEEASHTCFSIKDDEGFHWTNEISNILELDPNIKVNLTEKNYIYNYASKESIKKINNALSDLTLNNPINVEYKIITAKGNVKYLRTFLKLKKYDDNNIIRLGFTQDITEETIAKNSAFNLQENIEYLQGFSKIIIAEYEDGEYTFTDEVYNILETTPEEYTYNDLVNFMFPKDKEIFLNKMNNLSYENPSFKFTFRDMSAKGNVVIFTTHAIGKFDENGELIKILGFIQDVTEEKLALEKAERLQKDLSIIQSSSKIVLGHSKNGKYTFTSEIYNILEINPDDYPEGIDLINYFTIFEDKDVINDKMVCLTPENPRFHNIAKVKTPNDNIKILEGFIEGEFDEDGKLLSTVSFIQEITDKVKREEELEQLSEDRKILLQEVHHRVKNNLQLILSFLSLESRYNRDNPEYVIEQTKNRINTMALTHEEVYKSSSVSHVNLKEFLIQGVNKLFNLYTNGNIKPHFNLENIEVEMEKSIPLGLLVNEVALNTIKYAFPENNEGNFYINLKKINEDVILKIWDDGVGLPSTVDVFQADSLGFIIIRNLTQQIEAELTLLEDVSGFGLQVSFEQ